jgi:putative ribosome biogenesis GTPase RsgA
VINAEQAIVEAVLPRRTLFARRAAGRPRRPAAIAANIDLVFLVCGLDGDFNVRRLERYLTLGAESGADAVVVLNKTDLCADLAARIGETATVAGDRTHRRRAHAEPRGDRSTAALSGRRAHGGAAGIFGAWANRR